MRRTVTALTVTFLIALAGCGGGSDSAETTADSPVTDAPAATEAPTTEAPVEPEAPVVTEAPTPETEPPTTPTETAAPEGMVAVSLVEWAVEAPTTIASGPVTFEVANNGNFPHHLAVARGDSYETLPQIGGGAVDEATLGADFVGRTDNVQSGTSATIEFDLAPGNYVLFCNIATTVSHAAQGQVLSVTVG